MHRVLLIALTGALCVAASTAAWSAEKMRGNKVFASGCTSFKVPFCTMLKTGKSSYALIGASVPAGIGVTLVGEKGDYNFLCGAWSLRVISWKPNRMKCPM
ncbi:hypothetical protein [Undibacter mobilis]|uniref:Uncharacterized protein n=1 Tax=Undibacter mobilis TaxID=2292256 RepID=A0A371B0V7_9BRAD|nr:hypothetical protein [Undibacter mobilis]RDV01113.1 hypothetical protein DXH78_17905 [Undibacter mobilis]